MAEYPEDDPLLGTIEGKYRPSKWKETFSTLGGCIVILFIPVFILIASFKKADWLVYYGYPFCGIITLIAFILVLPVSLILLIFQKTRGWAGLGFVIVSYMFGFATWIWALILAFMFAGLVWVIIGICFYGIGVVPVAVIATALRGQWNLTIELLVSVAVIYLFRIGGTYLVNKEDERLKAEWIGVDDSL